MSKKEKRLTKREGKTKGGFWVKSYLKKKDVSGGGNLVSLWKVMLEKKKIFREKRKRGLF